MLLYTYKNRMIYKGIKYIMIRNIIFDFGNVILEWNEEKLVTIFSDEKEEQEILKNVIFKSKEWFKLDEGTLDYNTAITIFEEKLPANLKDKVKEIMNTWYKCRPINQEIANLIKQLKKNGYKIMHYQIHTFLYMNI